LNDPALAAGVAEVDTEGAKMFVFLNTIDHKAAATKAANDIAFVKRTLEYPLQRSEYLLHQACACVRCGNDRAGQRPPGSARIGPGGGVRFELASYVNFALGYAWNVNRQVNEDKGAFFFIGARDLFQPDKRFCTHKAYGGLVIANLFQRALDR
jgi:hypothetical protein